MQQVIWTLLGAHVAGVVLAAIAGFRSIRAGLAVAAFAPTITAIWAIWLFVSQDGLAGADGPPTSELVWVEGLDLAFRMQVDSLALLMTLLVSGIGALVFIYAIGYFAPDAAGGATFPPTLLAFSASMLGLVWSDSIWTLFIFWEATSITSFLLVGHKNSDANVQTAARRALMITGVGGLVLLAGLIILAQDVGSSTLTNLAAAEGSRATLAAILVMIGAATKSAQVPFHVWLPGAMAAPTPVSAYLHSATMVKAGVLLVAVMGTTFADVQAWKVLGLAFGIASMIWGGVGALRHVDAKLILAWGTISQLGLLITLLALGTGKAVFAATSILFAHAIFKAGLFLIVGEVDIRTGTRDIRKLGGLAKSMPITFAVALLSGLSMAGAPPLLGFPAKEAAIEAVLGLSGWEQIIGVVSVVGGAVLTVAYTTRFLIGVFGAGPDTIVKPRRLAMTIPAVVLGFLSVAGFAALGLVNDIVRPAAIELNAKSEVYGLVRWPGIKTAFVVSMAVLIVGFALGVGAAARKVASAPNATGADAADGLIDGILSNTPRFIAVVQHGSLPVYLATMTAAVAVAGIAFTDQVSLSHLQLWDTPLQGVLAAGIVAAAAAGAAVRSRLGATLTLGATGIGMSGIFIIHGAPDLALTQLLVEIIVVVGFVLGLGQLANQFPTVDNAWRATRLAVATLGGLAVMAGLAASSANPSGVAPIEDLTAGAVNDGGGNNVVNVILTDVRALDTLGEVVVLATVAIGILALANTRRAEA